MNHPHDFSPDDSIQQIHNEEGETPTKRNWFGNHMLQWQERQDAQWNGVQIANEGRFSEAVGLASFGGEDGAVIAVQKYWYKGSEACDVEEGDGGVGIADGRHCRRFRRRRGRRHGHGRKPIAERWWWVMVMVMCRTYLLVPKHGNSPFIDGSSRFMDGYVNISVYELGWPIHVRVSSISHPLFSSASLRFGVVGWTYVELYVISSYFVYYPFLPCCPIIYSSYLLPTANNN